MAWEITTEAPPRGGLHTQSLLVDLHLHTVVSPCAEVEMIPPLIVQRALALGLGLLAVTDHNSAENCRAVMQAAAAARGNLAVLPGMETQTAEDVHVLCLFDTIEQALTWQGIVYDHLPDRPNPEEILGGQFIVDADGNYLRTEERLLLTACDLPLNDVVRRVQALGGIAIPAHIDRPSFSLLANLGFVPPGLDVPALEIFRHSDPARLQAAHPDLAAWPLIRGSDAHQLSAMVGALRLNLERPDTAGLLAAFAGRGGCSFTLA